jgi:hypothetical protein
VKRYIDINKTNVSLSSHIFEHIQKTTTCTYGNSCPGSGQAYKCCLNKPVNDTPNLSIDNRVSNGNEDITKQWNENCKDLFPPRKNTLYAKNEWQHYIWTVHIAYSVKDHSYITTSREGIIYWLGNIPPTYLKASITH